MYASKSLSQGLLRVKCGTVIGFEVNHCCYCLHTRFMHTCSIVVLLFVLEYNFSGISRANAMLNWFRSLLSHIRKIWPDGNCFWDKALICNPKFCGYIHCKSWRDNTRPTSCSLLKFHTKSKLLPKLLDIFLPKL